MTNLPGHCARRAIITDTCRTNHGDAGAIEEALRRIREAYDQAVTGWTIGKGAQIHVAITIERPA